MESLQKRYDYQLKLRQRLDKENSDLKDKLTYSEACLRSARNNEKVYQDKLHRRNMQIKDLKAQLEQMTKDRDHYWSMYDKKLNA